VVKKTQSKVVRQTIIPVRPKTRVRNRRAMRTASGAIGGAPGGAPTPTWQRLVCPVPRQEQSQWCWAATSLGVHKFYQPADTTSQCQAVNLILARTDACTNPTHPAVNKPWYLDKSLAAFGHLRQPTLGRALTFPEVQLEIAAQRVPATRIGWNGGGGHFMVVEGVLASNPPRVAIHDPIYGRSDMDYAAYLSSYQGSGQWTHSYLTR